MAQAGTGLPLRAWEVRSISHGPPVRALASCLDQVGDSKIIRAGRLGVARLLFAQLPQQAANCPMRFFELFLQPS